MAHYRAIPNTRSYDLVGDAVLVEHQFNHVADKKTYVSVVFKNARRRAFIIILRRDEIEEIA